MKLIIAILGLLLLAFCSTSAAYVYNIPSDWGKGTCKNAHPNVQKAIEQFCNKSGKMARSSTTPSSSYMHANRELISSPLPSGQPTANVSVMLS
jgi:hypothetical protein